ncbi:MAG: hypothetical protein AB7L09_01340 [Nitrospira sp.]
MIKPGEAAKKNDALNIKATRAAEERIDSLLAERYFSGGSVHMDYSYIGLEYHLQEDLLDRYRRAGWKIEHFSDQREGTSYVVFSKDD